MMCDVIQFWPLTGFLICAAAVVIVIVVERKRRDTAPPHDVGDTHFHEWGEDDESDEGT